jgi:hypothetical protein
MSCAYGCIISCVDCAECNECLCDECTNSSPHQGKCHHIPCPTEKFIALVDFLVEDACVGNFMSLCFNLLDFMLSLLPSLSSPCIS